MSELERTTKVVSVSQYPIKIELNRGMKGQYGWSIHIEAEDMNTALFLIETLDQELRRKFSSQQEKPSLNVKKSSIEEDVVLP
jgi:hypothetical protein